MDVDEAESGKGRGGSKLMPPKVWGPTRLAGFLANLNSPTGRGAFGLVQKPRN